MSHPETERTSVDDLLNEYTLACVELERMRIAQPLVPTNQYVSLANQITSAMKRHADLRAEIIERMR